MDSLNPHEAPKQRFDSSGDSLASWVMAVSWERNKSAIPYLTVPRLPCRGAGGGCRWTGRGCEVARLQGRARVAPGPRIGLIGSSLSPESPEDLPWLLADRDREGCGRNNPAHAACSPRTATVVACFTRRSVGQRRPSAGLAGSAGFLGVNPSLGPGWHGNFPTRTPRCNCYGRLCVPKSVFWSRSVEGGHWVSRGLVGQLGCEIGVRMHVVPSLVNDMSIPKGLRAGCFCNKCAYYCVR